MGNSAAKEAREGSTSESNRPASASRHSSASDVSGTPSHRTFRSHSHQGQRDNHSGVVASTRSSIRHALNLDEQVDGGYLVPQGVYTGPQDFKARIVRQLQVDRRLAPFFKGLEDYDDSWTGAQLIAAVRGQPIPPADAPDTFVPAQPTQRARSKSNVESPPTAPGRRSRANTASSGSDKKPLEATLYRGAIECPICFLFYPPYLNSTRCCDQPICSECFVQIKRADPHVPEHENENNSQYDLRSATPFGMIELISEPACCPYCTEPDFGVTYQPPPFRTGLSSSPASALRATLSRHSSTPSAMSLNNSSSASVNSGTSQPGVRRRQTLPSSASEVVTTDRIRPDWALKLANANAHAARRAAAATALHSAAFLADNMGDTTSSSIGGFRQSGRNRLLPRPSGLDILMSGGHPSALSTSPTSPPPSGSRSSAGTSSSPSRRARRMVDLEEMMVMEAIRISLLEDEARQQREREQAQRGSEVLQQRRASATASPTGTTSPSTPPVSATEPPAENDSAATAIPYPLPAQQETASTSSASLVSAASSAESDLPHQARTLADPVTASSSSSSLTAASQPPGFSYGSLTGTLMVDNTSNCVTNGSTVDTRPAADDSKGNDAESRKGKDRVSDMKIEDTTVRQSGPHLQAA
ncbi:hypothetical protein V1525DRAFT_416473 [Lipomyces kononenkoae]|uniref:Uncharacterized protein n=1 Tax=Lipomyces kononenkoae TaxID=34357 RepID=A0ACC3T9P5_LIPKO